MELQINNLTETERSSHQILGGKNYNVYPQNRFYFKLTRKCEDTVSVKLRRFWKTYFTEHSTKTFECNLFQKVSYNVCWTKIQEVY